MNVLYEIPRVIVVIHLGYLVPAQLWRDNLPIYGVGGLRRCTYRRKL